MIPGRREYNLIGTDEDPIPPNEPVFIIRAQDALWSLAIRHYALLCNTILHNPRMAAKVIEHAELGEVWPTKKNPDL